MLRLDERALRNTNSSPRSEFSGFLCCSLHRAICFVTAFDLVTFDLPAFERACSTLRGSIVDATVAELPTTELTTAELITEDLPVWASTIGRDRDTERDDRARSERDSDDSDSDDNDSDDTDTESDDKQPERDDSQCVKILELTVENALALLSALLTSSTLPSFNPAIVQLCRPSTLPSFNAGPSFSCPSTLAVRTLPLSRRFCSPTHILQETCLQKAWLPSGPDGLHRSPLGAAL